MSDPIIQPAVTPAMKRLLRRMGRCTDCGHALVDGQCPQQHKARKRAYWRRNAARLNAVRRARYRHDVWARVMGAVYGER
jgi:hypothetical protein